MGKYKIYPLRVGTTIRERSNVEFQKDAGTTIELPVIVYYATDGEHKILCDTGGDPADGVKHMPYYQEADEFCDKQLAKLGVSCDEIDTVFLTHAHWDHSSNNHLFKNAKIYVQKEELRYAAAPLPIHKKLYNQQVVFGTEYVILDGDVDNILPGVSVILTPGHSEGSQSILFDTEQGIYAVTGDLINTYRCWESEPKIVNGLHTDIGVFYKSYEKLEKRCDHVLPGHELKVFEHSVYPYN